jgi:hypothetical protein
MVHSHFTLCLRTRPQTKWVAQHPWYGLWMIIKGPHHFMVTALGSCVKWPLRLGTPCEPTFACHERARPSVGTAFYSSLFSTWNSGACINICIDWTLHLLNLSYILQRCLDNHGPTSGRQTYIYIIFLRQGPHMLRFFHGAALVTHFGYSLFNLLWHGQACGNINLHQHGPSPFDIPLIQGDSYVCV